MDLNKTTPSSQLQANSSQGSQERVESSDIRIFSEHKVLRVFISREVAEKALRICREDQLSTRSLSRCVESIIIAYEKLRQIADLLVLTTL